MSLRSFILLVSIVVAISVSQLVEAADVSDANISGHVLDAETGEHMPGCVVKILNNVSSMKIK